MGEDIIYYVEVKLRIPRKIKKVLKTALAKKLNLSPNVFRMGFTEDLKILVFHKGKFPPFRYLKKYEQIKNL